MNAEEPKSFLASIVRLLEAESDGPDLYIAALREFAGMHPTTVAVAFYLAKESDGARTRLALNAALVPPQCKAFPWPDSVSESELVPRRAEDGWLTVHRIYEDNRIAGMVAAVFSGQGPSDSSDAGLAELALGFKILIRDQSLEAALRAAETRARKIEQGASETESLVFNVIHDMKAPLRVLQGYAAALHEDFRDALPPEASNYVSRIHGAAGSLETLLQGLLDYSRALLGEYRMGPVNSMRILAEVLTALEPLISKRNAVIESSGVVSSVVADTATLRSVMRNIIENALKFTQISHAPRIRITSQETNKTVRIVFDDNGIGVPPEAADKIFGLFERLHGRESFAGAGIGLALVRKALARMGGDCGVEQKQGEAGSRFWIELKKAPPT